MNKDFIRDAISSAKETVRDLGSILNISDDVKIGWDEMINQIYKQE
jgi:hypothetical protein